MLDNYHPVVQIVLSVLISACYACIWYYFTFDYFSYEFPEQCLTVGMGIYLLIINTIENYVLN